jgi:putative solute:sodium symporter small subunit
MNPDLNPSSAALPADQPAPESPPVLRHWQRVRLLTGSLLLVWALVSFGFVFYARELSDVKLLGTPLPFYMAAQGTMLVYLAIIGTYAYAMKKLDALAGKTRGGSDGQ